MAEPLESLLARTFDGRVVPHRDDPHNRYSDFADDPLVLYPWSDAGLSHAIQIKEQLGPNGFLRSGLSSSGDGPVQTGGGLVVDLTGFTRIEVRGSSIEVEAGATTRQLADVLVQNDLFLPLGDNPVQSVVAGVLSDRPGRFDRSADRLRDHVESLQVVTPLGELATGDFSAGGAIKTITFSAVADPVEAISARFLYSREEFETALRLLAEADVAPAMDLSVHAYHDTLGVIVVEVTVAGRPADHDRMAALLGSYDNVAVTGQTFGSGGHHVDRSLVARHYERRVDDFEAFRGPFLERLMVALAEPPSGKAPRVAGSLRLSLDGSGNVVVSADVFLPTDPQDAEVRLERVATRILGPPATSRPAPGEAPDLSALTAVPTAAQIPGFGGQIYAPGDPDYDKARTQYASSSYPEEQGPDGAMHPCMVAYPRAGTDDVGAAIRYATQNAKKIQARSGGHQYCGLSSGPMDTILLSMDLYSDIEVTHSDGKSYATVGAGALLTNIAATFNSEGVTIPHGECPRVAIGGHVQSGGYGHLLRSYGLALDHVHEFTIYRADGTPVTVTRPDTQDESSLFWGVLGGGPGSFGVLTDVTFEAIADVDHPYSWGYKSAYIYDKDLFRNGMDEIRRWTELVAARSPDLPADVDMCMTVVSRDWPVDGIYLLEMVDGNTSGTDGGGTNIAFLKTAIHNIAADYYAIPCQGYEDYETLSYMANSFVRRSGTTPDGREFAQPYKKRLNCTKQPLTTTFVESFVDLVDSVVMSDTVLLVFQMFIGGGAYAAPVPEPPLNSICHRDVVLGIVFDCFYKTDGEKDAEAFQQKMQGLLADYSGTQEIRMLWGSFGDTDIRDDEIRGFYYDDATWKGLQQLKSEVDAGDVFHTRFTVQLP